MTEKGLKVHVKTIKALCTDKKFAAMKTSKFPCSVCKRGVRRNSIFCIKCNSWVHKRCSDIWKCITKAVDFKYIICSGFTGNANVMIMEIRH